MSPFVKAKFDIVQHVDDNVKRGRGGCAPQETTAGLVVAPYACSGNTGDLREASKSRGRHDSHLAQGVWATSDTHIGVGRAVGSCSPRRSVSPRPRTSISPRCESLESHRSHKFTQRETDHINIFGGPCHIEIVGRRGAGVLCTHRSRPEHTIQTQEDSARLLGDHSHIEIAGRRGASHMADIDNVVRRARGSYSPMRNRSAWRGPEDRRRQSSVSPVHWEPRTPDSRSPRRAPLPLKIEASCSRQLWTPSRNAPVELNTDRSRSSSTLLGTHDEVAATDGAQLDLMASSRPSSRSPMTCRSNDAAALIFRREPSPNAPMTCRSNDAASFCSVALKHARAPAPIPVNSSAYFEALSSNRRPAWR